MALEIMFKFNSKIEIGKALPEFSQDEVKNEPMLFNCNREFAYTLGGKLTKTFIDSLPSKFAYSRDLVIDSRVHMLMAGWYPCIPGFHHDDVPREREDKQPNYINPSYKAEHCMALVGDCCPTEFAVGEAEFPDVPLGEVCYKKWHPMVVDKIKSGELKSFSAPSNKLIYFDYHTWHQGIPAIKGGWRWFVRATINTKREPTNELRKQVQTYLAFPMEGW
jgi:hypothetical protein